MKPGQNDPNRRQNQFFLLTSIMCRDSDDSLSVPACHLSRAGKSGNIRRWSQLPILLS